MPPLLEFLKFRLWGFHKRTNGGCIIGRDYTEAASTKCEDRLSWKALTKVSREAFTAATTAAAATDVGSWKLRALAF